MRKAKAKFYNEDDELVAEGEAYMMETEEFFLDDESNKVEFDNGDHFRMWLLDVEGSRFMVAEQVVIYAEIPNGEEGHNFKPIAVARSLREAEKFIETGEALMEIRQVDRPTGELIQ